MKKTKNKKTEMLRRNSRERNDDEVEPVPRVAEVREVSEHEASSEDLDDAFHRVDGCEYLSIQHQPRPALREQRGPSTLYEMLQ